MREKKELHPYNTFWVLHGISILISYISFFTILLFFTETVAPTPNLFSHAPSLHELNPHLPSPPRATAEAAGVIFSLSSFLYFSSSFPLKLPALFLISNLTKSLPSHLSPFFFIFHISSLFCFSLWLKPFSFSVYTCRNPVFVLLLIFMYLCGCILKFMIFAFECVWCLDQCVQLSGRVSLCVSFVLSRIISPLVFGIRGFRNSR